MCGRAYVNEITVSEASCPARLLSQIFKVLAEPNRLAILCALGTECRPVTDIIHATKLPQTNVSFHLRVLREAGLVRTERRGACIYYCLPDPELLAILQSLQGWVAAHVPSQELLNSENPHNKAISQTKRRTKACG